MSRTFLDIVTFLPQQSKAKRGLTEISAIVSVELGAFFVNHVKGLIDLVSEMEIDA